MQSTLEKIYELRMWWLREYQEYGSMVIDKFKPNVVYLGHDDWLSLLKENAGHLINLDYKEPKVFGMRIQRVAESHYMAVGRVYENLAGEGK